MPRRVPALPLLAALLLGAAGACASSRPDTTGADPTAAGGGDGAVFSTPVIPAECAALHLPYGPPVVAGPAEPLTPLCRDGFLLIHDDARLVPRWVAYQLSADGARSCLPRTNRYRADPDLPRGRRAELRDYAGSGWDRGHMAADADLRDVAEADYLSNTAPQDPTLNRGLWARLEAMTRAWAEQRGVVVVLAGPWFEGAVAPGRTGRVAVPAGFWRLVVDPGTYESIAFLVPNAPLSWSADPARYVVAPAAVEAAAGLRLPAPWWGKMHPPATEPWPADLAAAERLRAERCRPATATEAAATP